MLPICLALLMLVGLTASALAAETPSRPPKTEAGSVRR